MAPDYARFLNDMALLLHEVALFQILNSYVDGSQFDRAIINNIVKNTSAEQIQLYYQIVIKGQDEIKLAPDSKIGFEMTIIRMFAFKIGNPQGFTHNNSVQNNDQTRNIATNSGQVQSQQNNNSGTVMESPNVTPVSPATLRHSTNEQVVSIGDQSDPSQSFHLKDITEKNWNRIFAQLQLKGTARELARNAHIISNSNGALVLAIDKQAHAFMTENAQQKLKSAIENMITEQISIKLVQDVEVAKTIAKTEQVSRDAKVRETKDKVQKNPFIQHMQDNFDAEVIQIKHGESFI